MSQHIVAIDASPGNSEIYWGLEECMCSVKGFEIYFMFSHQTFQSHCYIPQIVSYRYTHEYFYRTSNSEVEAAEMLCTLTE